MSKPAKALKQFSWKANEPLSDASAFASQTPPVNARQHDNSPTFCPSSLLSSRESCLPGAALRRTLRRCYLAQSFTCSFAIVVRNQLRLRKRRRLRGTRSAGFADKKQSQQTTIGIQNRPLFCRLCWAAPRTHKLSQPHRTTTEFTNNHCLTICLTQCEQGSLV